MPTWMPTHSKNIQCSIFCPSIVLSGTVSHLVSPSETDRSQLDKAFYLCLETLVVMKCLSPRPAMSGLAVIGRSKGESYCCPLGHTATDKTVKKKAAVGFVECRPNPWYERGHD